MDGNGQRTGDPMGSEEADMIIKGYESEDDLAGMIENEGLDYFFTEYLDPDKILDDKLRVSVMNWQNQRNDAIDRLSELGVEVG